MAKASIGASRKPAPKAAGKSSPIKANRATMVDCGPRTTEKTVEIRKIENGFIVRESTYGPKGYKTSERFTAKAPTIEIEPTKGKARES